MNDIPIEPSIVQRILRSSLASCVRERMQNAVIEDTMEVVALSESIELDGNLDVIGSDAQASIKRLHARYGVLSVFNARVAELIAEAISNR